MTNDLGIVTDGLRSNDDVARAAVLSAVARSHIATDDFVTALLAAETFIDAARAARDETARLGMRQCIVFLHAASGPPVLAIDNVPSGMTDEQRLTITGDQIPWRINPAFVRLRERVEFIGADAIAPEVMQSAGTSVGYTGPQLHVFAAPVMGASGWFATVLCGSHAPHSAALSLELAMIASRLTAWCGARGIERVPELQESSWLSKRQFRIAQLAVAGGTNQEIAAQLGISINTVKVRLKQAFARLGVTSREQLGLLLRQLSALDGVPMGVSRHGHVTVTRDAELASWVP